MEQKINFDKFKKRLHNYSSSFANLKEGINEKDDFSSLEEDGILKRYELCFELSWKLMQDYLDLIGIQNIKGPRPSIIEMGNLNVLDPLVWGNMLSARNELSHIYDEGMSRNYLLEIKNDFIAEFEVLENHMLNYKII
jgi:nucleotidyltransferase substrate binding protein (TIGR01987 family)